MLKYGIIIQVILLLLIGCDSPIYSSSDEPSPNGDALEDQTTSRLLSVWQQHDGLEVSVDNPTGIKKFTCIPRINGEICEYEDATVPLSGDAGWFSAPDRNTIEYTNPSKVCDIAQACMVYGDFTYFQNFLEIKPGTVVSNLVVTFSDVDDGARVSICNSMYPECEVVPDSYVYYNDLETGNLAELIVAGEVNRIVVTLVDDCCATTSLGGANVILNNGTSM